MIAYLTIANVDKARYRRESVALSDALSKFINFFSDCIIDRIVQETENGFISQQKECQLRWPPAWEVCEGPLIPAFNNRRLVDFRESGAYEHKEHSLKQSSKRGVL